MKHTVQMIGVVMDEVGSAFREKADSVKDGSRVMNVQTDIKIFIEHHSSGTPPAQLEEFQEYQSSEAIDLSAAIFPNLAGSSKNN